MQPQRRVQLDSTAVQVQVHAYHVLRVDMDQQQQWVILFARDHAVQGTTALQLGSRKQRAQVNALVGTMDQQQDLQ